MSAPAFDYEITDGAIRQLREHQRLELRMAAQYRDDDTNDAEGHAARMELGAKRWAQLVAWAPRVFAECDRLEALAARTARDAETEACDAPTIVLEV